MKVLIVLVLAVFTGCNANLLFADAPKSKLDELSDTFWHYVAKSRHTVRETYKNFKQTEFGQELSTSLEDSAKLATMYGEIAWDQVPEGIQHGLGGISMGFYGLGLKIDEGMETLKEKLEPITEKVAPVAEKVGSELTQRSQQVIDFASPYVEKLMEKVDPVVQNVQARLDTLYESF